MNKRSLAARLGSLKPHLDYMGGLWWCVGQGRCYPAGSMQDAYMNWILYS